MRNETLVKRIIEMRKVDQNLRLRGRGKQRSLANYLVYLVDAVHNYWIWRLINSYGYPTRELVGEDTLQAFWLLVQHQDRDSKLQQLCLDNCDFNPENRAYLTDRVLMNTSKKQRYGTQFYRGEDGILRPWPTEDNNTLDQRRASVYLPTFSEQLASADRVEQELWGKHIGGPPFE